MSALPPKADMLGVGTDFRQVPRTDILDKAALKGNAFVQPTRRVLMADISVRALRPEQLQIST